MLTKEEFMEKVKCRDPQKISRLVLTNPQYCLPGKTQQVYDLLRYIGSELPREFDLEDLAEVVADLVNNLVKCMFSPMPKGILPDCIMENPKWVINNLGNITEIIGNVVEDNKRWKANFEEKFVKSLKK